MPMIMLTPAPTKPTASDSCAPKDGAAENVPPRVVGVQPVPSITRELLSGLASAPRRLRRCYDLYMPEEAFLASQSIFHWKKELPPISPKVRKVTHGLVSDTVV